MATQTMAQKIAAMFGEDGTCWRIERDGEDVTLAEACRHAGARREVVERGYAESGHALEPATVYAFADGSAIVAMGGAWDLRPEGCEAACWAGVGCQCEDEEECGTLTDSDTAEEIGPATREQAEASRAAGAEGHILIDPAGRVLREDERAGDSRRVYVQE